jgi:hypothetical protein
LQERSRLIRTDRIGSGRRDGFRNRFRHDFRDRFRRSSRDRLGFSHQRTLVAHMLAMPAAALVAHRPPFRHRDTSVVYVAQHDCTHPGIDRFEEDDRQRVAIHHDRNVGGPAAPRACTQTARRTTPHAPTVPRGARCSWDRHTR